MVQSPLSQIENNLRHSIPSAAVSSRSLLDDLSSSWTWNRNRGNVREILLGRVHFWESDQSEVDNDEQCSDNLRRLDIRGSLLDVIAVTPNGHGRRKCAGLF
jgi:hypothetical protein